MTQAEAATEDYWLRHLVTKQEVCPDKNKNCRLWHYLLTRSLKKEDGAIEISGRLLSRISDGIAAFAATAAAKLTNPPGEFHGVTYCDTTTIATQLDHYRVIPEPTTEDTAHAYISNEEHNKGDRSQLNVAKEVLILHETFSYAAVGSIELQYLEEHAGT